MTHTLALTPALRRISTTCAVGLLLFLSSPPTHAAEPPAEVVKEYQPQKDEFATLGEAVLKLLRDGDTARFATNLAPNAEDWKSILSTNLPAAAEDPLKRF